MSDSCLTPERAAELCEAVRARYRTVAARPAGHFPYPVGRASAVRLGYEAAWLAAVPADLVDRFVGVGNPFTLGRPAAGERVLDLGCGCGLDAFVASLLVGPDGRVAGLDLTPEMLERPRQAAARWPLANLELHLGSAEQLPFPDAAFDRVLSNGVLNLVPHKDAAFAEIARVLRPGGVLAAVDLLVVDAIPRDVLAGMDAWST